MKPKLISRDRRGRLPKGTDQRSLVAPRPGLPEQSRKQAGDARLPARARAQPGQSPGLVQRRHDPARGRHASSRAPVLSCAPSSSIPSSRRSGATSARCNSSSANSSIRSIRSTARWGSSPITRAPGTISPVLFARSTSSTRRNAAAIARSIIKPDYADPSFKLGTIYFQEGRMEEAEKAFRKVLEAQSRLSAGGTLSCHGAGADQSPRGSARDLRNGRHASGRNGIALAGVERNGVSSLRKWRVRRGHPRLRKGAHLHAGTGRHLARCGRRLISNWASSTRPGVITSRPWNSTPNWLAPGITSALSGRNWAMPKAVRKPSRKPSGFWRGDHRPRQ